MLVSERDKAVAKAIDFIKSCPYKGTAIKVELEAELNRDGRSCDYCDSDGEVYDEETDSYGTCSECGGSTSDWDSERDCQNFIESHVSDEAKKALIFGKFYNDGSVDSEYTFTVPIDKPEVVIEYINAFKALADEIGNGMDTEGAGMHIAILNSPNGSYPSNNVLSPRRVTNFAKSLVPLMPALYFLSSADHQSRGLSFRAPRVDARQKYSIVAPRNGVLEFRCFETCYQRPDAFYDYLCVISNALKLYSLKMVQLDFFGTIGELGIKNGYGVDRFFYTARHLDALEHGVKYLKPSYKTFSELKKERNFKVTKTVLVVNERKNESKWRSEFTEYINRTKALQADRRKTLEISWAEKVDHYGLEEMTRGNMTKELWIEQNINGYFHRTFDKVEDFIKNKKDQQERCDYIITV